MTEKEKEEKKKYHKRREFAQNRTQEQEKRQ